MQLYHLSNPSSSLKQANARLASNATWRLDGNTFCHVSQTWGARKRQNMKQLYIIYIIIYIYIYINILYTSLSKTSHGACLKTCPGDGNLPHCDVGSRAGSAFRAIASSSFPGVSSSGPRSASDFNCGSSYLQLRSTTDGLKHKTA